MSFLNPGLQVFSYNCLDFRISKCLSIWLLLSSSNSESVLEQSVYSRNNKFTKTILKHSYVTFIFHKKLRISLYSKPFINCTLKCIINAHLYYITCLLLLHTESFLPETRKVHHIGDL